MKLSIPLLALVPLALAGSSLLDNEAATVTVTRTIATCPCDDTKTTVWGTLDISSSTEASTETSTTSASSSITTTTTSSADTSTTTDVTISSTTASTTTSSAATTTSAAPGTVSNPNTDFTPSGQISNNGLVKRATVYIDSSNPNALKLTTDSTKATKFKIDAQGHLSTTINSYYNDCGTSTIGDTPGLFQCSNAGVVYQTFTGWTNNPTFTYQTWSFCYKSDLKLYLARNGPTADCQGITFTASFDGSVSGSA